MILDKCEEFYQNSTWFDLPTAMYNCPWIFLQIHISHRKAHLLSFGHKFVHFKENCSGLWFINLALGPHFQTSEGRQDSCVAGRRSRPRYLGPWRPLEWVRFSSKIQASVGRLWAVDCVREDLWSQFKPVIKKRGKTFHNVELTTTSPTDIPISPWDVSRLLSFAASSGEMGSGAESVVQVTYVIVSGQRDNTFCVLPRFSRQTCAQKRKRRWNDAWGDLFQVIDYINVLELAIINII